MADKKIKETKSSTKNKLVIVVGLIFLIIALMGLGFWLLGFEEMCYRTQRLICLFPSYLVKPL